MVEIMNYNNDELEDIYSFQDANRKVDIFMIINNRLDIKEVERKLSEYISEQFYYNEFFFNKDKTSCLMIGNVKNVVALRKGNFDNIVNLQKINNRLSEFSEFEFKTIIEGTVRGNCDLYVAKEYGREFVSNFFNRNIFHVRTSDLYIFCKYFYNFDGFDYYFGGDSFCIEKPRNYFRPFVFLYS